MTEIGAFINGLAEDATPDTANDLLLEYDTSTTSVKKVKMANVSAGVTDAADLTYTPADATNWNSGADPGDTNEALDQLAARVKSLEGGGRVLIASATPTGTATQTFSSIPATYSHLLLRFAIRSTQAATNVDANCFVNNDNTAANYRQTLVIAHSAGTVGGAGADANTMDTLLSGDTGPAGSYTVGELRIPFYANTGFNKQLFLQMGHRRNTSTTHEMNEIMATEWENAAAINRLDIVLAAGNYKTGTTFQLYGEY